MARSVFGPEYRKLWTASTISNLGDGVTLVAGPLLAASLTRDPALVAGLTFAQRVPWLLLPLISGALVDRLDRRRVMSYVDAARTVLIGALGVAVLLLGSVLAGRFRRRFLSAPWFSPWSPSLEALSWCGRCSYSSAS